jgi:hypothetical protein
VVERLFDKATIELALDAVAAHLEPQGSRPATLVVVGGSFMALHELRESTRDIDSATPITSSIRLAVEAVAEELRLEPNWLNDRAAMYVPQGLRDESYEVALDRPSLRVLLPPPDYVFVMKLYAARGAIDHDDMVRLWPRCSFESTEAAVALYWEAYPHALPDEHLGTYIDEIAHEAALLEG